MGMDLTLYPFSQWRIYNNDWGTGKSVWFLGVDRLSFDRQYYLFSQVSEAVMGCDERLPKAVCKPEPLPKTVRFTNYEDEGIKDRTTDRYGSPLTYVTAGELAKVKQHKDLTPWNKAILTLVAALPADMPILLWWH